MNQTTTVRQRALVVAEPDARRLRSLLAARRQTAWRDEAHLNELESELERASLVAADAVPADVVVMDSVVSVLDLSNRERREYTLVYPAEADPVAGRISVLAPLGTALLGYREGDDVEWLMPGGLRRLRIVKVRSRYEAANEVLRAVQCDVLLVPERASREFRGDAGERLAS